MDSFKGNLGGREGPLGIKKKPSAADENRSEAEGQPDKHAGLARSIDTVQKLREKVAVWQQILQRRKGDARKGIAFVEHTSLSEPVTASFSSDAVNSAATTWSLPPTYRSTTASPVQIDPQRSQHFHPSF